MNVINSLGFWQWALLWAVIPAIIALYFLKLKRHPVEVPSTYLWTRTIEDLHVNSIWQRLRQSLLLFLQLLLVLLLIAACWRPGWRGVQLTGDRFIFLVDTSASMNATDVDPTRLDVAKQQILDLIDEMRSEDVAMVISFSDVARVEQSFSDSRSLLRQSVSRIRPTNRTSDLREALRAAAGLANPGRASDKESATDIQVAEPLPATLYLYTDGGFAALPDFSLGNLEPRYMQVGHQDAENAAWEAFTAERNQERPDQIQAFARIANATADPITAQVSLDILEEDGRWQLVDATSVTVPARQSSGVEFNLPGVERATLRLTLERPDDLGLDNVAYTAIHPPRPARVALVTTGNEAVQLALDTDEALAVAEVVVVDPAVWETKPQQDLAQAGVYDLVIFDRQPPRAMPQSNTLCIGCLLPVDGWSAGSPQSGPVVIDTDRVHPITEYVELSNVYIAQGTALTPPPGGATLVDSNIGSLLSIAPRGGYEDAVLGFDILDVNEAGQTVVNTDWFLRRTFPVFVMNAVRYLGGVRETASAASVQPGSPITLRTEIPVERVTVQRPDGRRIEVTGEGANRFTYADTELLGVYHVYEGASRTVTQQFTVNLFDSRESDLTPRADIELGYRQVAATAGLQPTRKELWKWILLLALLVLVAEWYIYNRRVYV
jgi:hypothetical protein